MKQATFLFFAAAGSMSIWLAWALVLWRHARAQKRQVSWSNESGPFVSVIVPVASLENRHLALIHRLANQRYSNYEVLVIYEQKLVEKLPKSRRLRFLANPRTHFETCSRKVSNLLLALEHVTPADGGLLAFLDDDVMVERSFVPSIAGILEHNSKSIVTSYRNINRPTGLLDTLLALGNNTFAPFMNFRRWRCIWGGCFAMEAALARHLDLARVWAGEVSDDLSLTNEAVRRGVPILALSVPLTTSLNDCRSAGDAFSWATRQFILGRHYLPRHFLELLCLSVLGVLCVAGSLMTMVALGLSHPWILILMLLLGLGGFMPARRIGLARSPYHFILTVAAIPPLFVFIACSAVTKKEVVWKGVRYRLCRQN